MICNKLPVDLDNRASEQSLYGGVMELVDVSDSKSDGGDTVAVRLRPPLPFVHYARFFYFPYLFLLSFCSKHSYEIDFD